MSTGGRDLSTPLALLSQVVLDHTRLAWRSRADTQLSFGERLARACHARFGAGCPVRLADPERASTAADFLAAREALRKQVARLAAGEVKFPLDLLEPWLEAMVEPYRSDCWRALIEREKAAIRGAKTAKLVRDGGTLFVLPD